MCNPAVAAMHRDVPGPSKAAEWTKKQGERVAHYKQSYWAAGLEDAPAEDPSQPRRPLAPPPLRGNEGTRYLRDDPSLPPDVKENKDLRMVGSIAAGFAPWRHQLVIKGRPVVVSPLALRFNVT